MLKLDKPNPFIIFAHARSGSSALKEMFDCQPNINVLGEPFNRNIDHTYLHMLESGGLNYVIKRIFFEFNGFKTLFAQLLKEENLWLFDNYKTIFLKRENLGQAAISLELAIQVKIWSVTDKYKYKKAEMPYLKKQNIERWIKAFEEETQYYEAYRNKNNSILVTYEELYEDDFDKSYEKVKRLFEFVEHEIKDEQSLKWWLSRDRKLNSNDIYMRIPNYEEIKCYTK